VFRHVFKNWTDFSAGARATGIVVVAVLGVACEQEAARPRSFEYFKEDGLAREGALARCNQDRDAAEADVECTNARRAGAAVAAELEQARSGELAAESERKLAAMRNLSARAEQAQQQAELAAQAAADAAYEAQWREVASLSQVPTRPALELAAVAPPVSEIARPEIQIEQNAIIPRPFRNDDETIRR
jgi:hypothetical protein